MAHYYDGDLIPSQGKSMSVFPHRSFLFTISATAMTVSITGCSINGSYEDASDPGAAKLRFISGMSNATFNVFDADHCDGLTTGMLNNILVANTKRRADMAAPPPVDAKAYIELRLKPEAEMYMMANTQGSYSVCSVGFNFKPQKDSEYELVFDYVGRRCRAVMNRLDQVDGSTVRSPVPLLNKGLSACVGRNAIFPKPVEAKEDTSERVELIEKIIAESIIEEMRPEPASADKNINYEGLRKAVEERKQRIGFTLPDSYWIEYRKNLDLFGVEALGNKGRALELYKKEYWKRLRSLKTESLKELAAGDDSSSLSKVLRSNNSMLKYYEETKREVLKETLNNHLARMADLDRRYSVCEQFAGCWRN